MDVLLIRGLRQLRVEGRRDWRELVTDAIRGDWPMPKASKRTQKAERGFGIDGKPYYILRPARQREFQPRRVCSERD